MKHIQLSWQAGGWHPTGMHSWFIVRSPPTTASLTTHQEQSNEYGIRCGAEIELAEKGGTTRGEETGLPFAWPQNSLSCVHLCHVTVNRSQEPNNHRIAISSSDMANIGSPWHIGKARSFIHA